MWWFIFALGSGLSAAVMAVVNKLYLFHINPALVTCIILAIGVLGLILGDLITGKIALRSMLLFTVADWLALAAAGLANTLGFILFFAALQSGKASWVVAVDRLSIVYVIIMSFVLLQEEITTTTVIGGSMMVLGATLLSR